MNLKDLFDKAENGTLTYDQFISAATEAKAKFVDLAEGNYVDKKKYTDDIASRDTRISTLDDTIKSRETDLADLKAQLDAAGTDKGKLAEITSNFTTLQEKYTKDTESYQKQLKEQAYKFAVTDFANKQNFTSQAAKRDFINSMLSKNLTVENDTIIGATDFVDAYTKENADAFVVNKQADEGSQSKPHFVDSTKQQESGGEKPSPFAFNFTGVRPHDNK